MENINSIQKQAKDPEDLRKKQIEEFLSFEYFYNGLNKLDTDGVQVFSKIIDCLNKDIIKFKELVQFIQAKRCIPDQARGVVWRILLNYLPENRKQWINIIENNSKHYEQLVNDYIVSKNKKKSERNDSNTDILSENDQNNIGIPNRSSVDSKIQDKEEINKQKMSKSTNLFDNAPTITLKNPLLKNGGDSKKKLEIIENCVDHPLNRKQTSSWNTYFKDLEIWDLIEKDTKRTRAEFYLQKNEQIRLYNGQVAKLFRKQNMASLQKPISQNNIQLQKTQLQNDNSKTQAKQEDNIEFEEYRYDVITRILFLYYKITPEDAKVKYVQGMNEIIGLIYQCFSQDNSPYLRSKAESDAFYCFCIVMTKIKAMFNFNKMENESSTIKTNSSKQLDSYKIYIDAFVEMFKKVDVQLFNYLAQINVDPRLCCLNWMIGFFCQSFDSQKAMQVWDCLFISNDIVEFIPFICTSILIINRDELIDKQHSEILMKLQNIQDINLDKLMKMAFNLYNEYSQKISFVR
ncbi:rab-GTPase-TBC domain protein (macronuclear) [Tetrahymena thermophila SB210]|uniref:Rab-GTPase-TBC domain protein n=1 Tax=Tetrahymena thermophila (strain SB210) TaxID=312017 RepID=Q23TD8_TETTS|nr:rab-GTPase-TBC domain protein [Tetrahymena thermophila SB210]EAR99768.1 rab-GTPase-TBC domain protein [Tetrahymena thermophila SB210]|eukprot:XP_001020013.1 rab-GTPase-TBC domain protein [Tetrahymena thermophila SB210]